MERERLNQFRSRFGNLPEGADVEFRRFKERVILATEEALGFLPDTTHQISVARDFALRVGSPLSFRLPRGIDDNRYHAFILTLLRAAGDLEELITRSQQLVWSFESVAPDYSAEIANSLACAIDLSPGINLRLQATPEGRFEFFPAGIGLMDDAVDLVTQWLFRYPDVQKEFRQTLVIFVGKKRAQYRQAQDSLRFALEKLLKIILNNHAPLENQPKNLKEWLAQHGVTKDLCNVAVQIMVILTHYHNDVVKHDNVVVGGAAKGWADHEVEYLLYQHTTLFRLLLEASEHGTTVCAI